MPKWVFPVSPGTADIEIMPKLERKRRLVRRQDVEGGRQTFLTPTWLPRPPEGPGSS
jgi:hypothetical protein